MPKLTNKQAIPLPIAIWAATSNYDSYSHIPDYISVTTLMKPLRQLLLRNHPDVQTTYQPDVGDFIASALGSSLHDSIEKAWLTNYSEALELLGFNPEHIARIRNNPSKDTDLTGLIPVYTEKRSFKTIGKYTIGGKFDLVLNGQVQDYKSTSTYSYGKVDKYEEYILQGSLYRWLNPDIITSNHMVINFIFKDWFKSKAMNSSDYPPAASVEVVLPLKSYTATEHWIKTKLELIDQYAGVPESEIPYCTDAELWYSDPKFKYYANPEKIAGRSTRNFDTLLEANDYLASKGKGVVITDKGVPKRCGYCAVSSVCSQVKTLLAPEIEPDNV